MSTLDILKTSRNLEREIRKGAVKLAREAGVCRLCLKKPTVPLILNYGGEYACRKCLHKEFLLESLCLECSNAEERM